MYKTPKVKRYKYFGDFIMLTTTQQTVTLWTSTRLMLSYHGSARVSDLVNMPDTIERGGNHIIIKSPTTPEALVLRAIYRIIESGSVPQVYLSKMHDDYLQQDEPQNIYQYLLYYIENAIDCQQYLSSLDNQGIELGEAREVAGVILKYSESPVLDLERLRQRANVHPLTWNEIVKEIQHKISNDTSNENNLSNKSSVYVDNRLLSNPLSTHQTDDDKVIEAIVCIVHGIVTSDSNEFVERLKLDKVYSQYKSKVNRKLFDSIVASQRVKHNEVLPEDELRLKSLFDYSQAKINWDEVLPSPLARDIKHDADELNIDPVMLWQALLPAVSSLAGGFKLNVYGGVPAINWTCTVLPSGGGKSRADTVVFSALRDMQQANDVAYDESMKEYKRALAAYEKSEQEDKVEPSKPVRRQYLFETTTIQGVTKRLSEQKEKKGTLWARDEIKGLFSSLNQFAAGGDSEAQEILLKFWDNVRGSVIRADSEKCYSYDSAVSVTGGIQNSVFRKAFSDPNDGNGMQARFLFALPEERRKKFVGDKVNLKDKLPVLYRWLEGLNPELVNLSPDARKYFATVVDEVADQIDKTSHAGIRTWMNKLDTHVLRIALALHLIECFYSPSTTEIKTLSLGTLKRAVAFAQYYRSAFHILQEKVSTSDDIASILLQIHTAALAMHPDGISARDVYKNSRPIQNRAKSAGREVGAYVADLFEKMTQMGYGEVVRKGRSVRFIAFPYENVEKSLSTVDNADNADNNPESPPEKSKSSPPIVQTKPIVSVDNQKNTDTDESKQCQTQQILGDLQDTQTNVGKYCCIKASGEIDLIVGYEIETGKYAVGCGHYSIGEIDVFGADFKLG